MHIHHTSKRTLWLCSAQFTTMVVINVSTSTPLLGCQFQNYCGDGYFVITSVCRSTTAILTVHSAFSVFSSRCTRSRLPSLILTGMLRYLMSGWAIDKSYGNAKVHTRLRNRYFHIEEPLESSPRASVIDR